MNPQNVAGPLFAGLDSDPPKEVRVRFDDEPAPRERVPLPEKVPARPKPAPRALEPPSLPFVEIAKTPAPTHDPPASPTSPESGESAAPRRPLHTVLFAWSIDLTFVAALTFVHAGLAAAVLGPERLAPGPAGSLDYWFDLFRGGGLFLLWVLLAATLALAYGAFSALLLGQTPGLALVTLSRLPRERSAP